MLFHLFALLWSIHLLSVTPTHALRFYVDPTTGDNRHSVQSAQDSATPFKTIAHALRIAHIVSESRPHVINIAGGTYSLSSGELFPLEITQTGIYIETTGLTIFDGENKTNFFKITGPTSDFLIKGIDFINGSAEKGGVAFCQTCSLRVADNRFFQNKASQNGHVIYTENGRLKFYNNLVRDSGTDNDTLAVLELRNSSVDTLVRDEIRNNTFYRNPSPNIWASGARTHISSNLFIDPRQAAIRDADSTAAPFIDHNLFWETEILYVSDKGDRRLGPLVYDQHPQRAQLALSRRHFEPRPTQHAHSLFRHKQPRYAVQISVRRGLSISDSSRRHRLPIRLQSPDPTHWRNPR